MNILCNMIAWYMVQSKNFINVSYYADPLLLSLCSKVPHKRTEVNRLCFQVFCAYWFLAGFRQWEARQEIGEQKEVRSQDVSTPLSALDGISTRKCIFEVLKQNNHLKFYNQ